MTPSGGSGRGGGRKARSTPPREVLTVRIEAGLREYARGLKPGEIRKLIEMALLHHCERGKTLMDIPAAPRGHEKQAREALVDGLEDKPFDPSKVAETRRGTYKTFYEVGQSIRAIIHANI